MTNSRAILVLTALLVALLVGVAIVRHGFGFGETVSPKIGSQK